MTPDSAFRYQFTLELSENWVQDLQDAFPMMDDEQANIDDLMELVMSYVEYDVVANSSKHFKWQGCIARDRGTYNYNDELTHITFFLADKNDAISKYEYRGKTREEMSAKNSLLTHAKSLSERLADLLVTGVPSGKMPTVKRPLFRVHSMGAYFNWNFDWMVFRGADIPLPEMTHPELSNAHTVKVDKAESSSSELFANAGSLLEQIETLVKDNARLTEENANLTRQMEAISQLLNGK